MGELKELQVVAVRYWGSRPSDEMELDAYEKTGVYSAAEVPFEVVMPEFPEEKRSEEEAENLGEIGSLIAEEVAAARREGKGVLMAGGNCANTTGVVGGLQEAHGSGTRIGLVWFDAHGDFNTPGTTLSGMLGGMPVAVCAGLAFPGWREGSRMAVPLPTERIILVDVRNLDPPEEQLIEATDVTVARVAPGFRGEDLATAVAELAERCDLIYLHIDADVLDGSLVPNHVTVESNGPNMEQVQAAVDTVMATGKVAAFAVVSVFGEGKGGETSLASGVEVIRGGLKSWRRHGMPGC
jgi:arginase